MITPQTVEGQSVRQPARIPDFQPVGEEAHLDRGIAVIITVGNRIDNGLSYCVGRKFVGGWGGDAGGASADRAVNLAQHEIKGLVSLAEEVTAIDLQGGEGTTVLGAVTVDTLGLGGTVELLWIGSEKEHGGMCWFSLFQQIEMDKQGLCGRVRFEREGALSAGGIQKHSTRLRDRWRREALSQGDVSKGGTRSAFAVKVVNKAGIHLCGQGAHIANTATDKLAAGFTDEDLHFSGPSFFIGAPDIYEPGLCEFPSIIVLALDGRDSILILATVFVTEDSQVNIATFHLLRGQPCWHDGPLWEAPQRGRHSRNEAVEYCIAEKESLEVSANFLKLFLNTADEYLELHSSSFAENPLAQY